MSVMIVRLWHKGRMYEQYSLIGSRRVRNAEELRKLEEHYDVEFWGMVPDEEEGRS